MITEKGGLAFSFTVDLTSRKKIYEAARIVKDQIGPICILVNNAGVLSGTSFLDTPDENIIRTFEVNVLAHFWTIKAFMPDMIVNKKGHIVSIASIGGHIGADKMVDYCSSKFASVGLDESLKVELKVQGHSDYIKTTVVCPYIFSTPLSAGMKSKVTRNHF
jgi:all-trans-retinol dehydrogenase (NAD+)